MVNAPDSLVWAIIGQNNSFMKKRNGRSSRTGAVRFSTEKGNLASLSTFKYSGLANSKAIDVTVSQGEKCSVASLSKKTVSKASNPAKARQSNPLKHTNFRATTKAITAQNSYYRA